MICWDEYDDNMQFMSGVIVVVVVNFPHRST